MLSFQSYDPQSALDNILNRINQLKNENVQFEVEYKFFKGVDDIEPADEYIIKICNQQNIQYLQNEEFELVQTLEHYLLIDHVSKEMQFSEIDGTLKKKDLVNLEGLRELFKSNDYNVEHVDIDENIGRLMISTKLDASVISWDYSKKTFLPLNFMRILDPQHKSEEYLRAETRYKNFRFDGNICSKSIYDFIQKNNKDIYEGIGEYKDYEVQKY